jgi:hypothetical protein
VLDLGDARGQQVVLAREVVADHAGARQTRVLRDPAERRVGLDVSFALAGNLTTQNISRASALSRGSISPVSIA